MNTLRATCTVVVFSVVAFAAHAQTPYELVDLANKQLEQGDAEQALKAYDQAAAKLPQQPELTYNRAVAHYRLGQFDEAKALFESALSNQDPQLEARARYNLGNVAYASALQIKDQQPERAVTDLDNAIEQYRRTLRVTPNDTDARANIELAELLKKQIADQQKQQQKKDPQNQENGEHQENDQNEQSDKDQQQDQSEQAESQNKPAEEQQDPQQNNDQKSGQAGQQQKDQPDSQDPSNQQDEAAKPPPDQQQERSESQEQNDQAGEPDNGDKQSSSGPQDSPGSEAAPEGELKTVNDQSPSEVKDSVEAQPVGEPKPLSPEEAQKLLQAIRDRDYQRRAEQVAREQAGQAPVDKDW